MALENAADFKDLLTNVKASVDRLESDTKFVAEEALKQARKTGDATAEVKAQADALMTELNGLRAQSKSLEEKIDGTASNLKDVEQALSQRSGGASAAMSVGQRFVTEGADALASFTARGASGSVMVNIQNAITTASPGGGGLIFPTEERTPVEMARRQLRIVDLLMRGTTDTDVVKYVRQTTRTNAAAPVAEEAAHPESTYVWTKTESPVRKIGHIVHISEEAMADAAQMQSTLDGEMRYGLELEVESQVLAGAGTGENLSGLITNATAFSAASGLPNDNPMDRLRLGMLQVEIADYAANGIVVNPTQGAAIDLIKKGTGDASYVYGAPGSGTVSTLWGLPIVRSNSMAAGTWLVGDFMGAATFYMRQGMEVLISSEHGTNFVDGMLTMRANVRCALAVKRPAALVTGNFTFV